MFTGFAAARKRRLFAQGMRTGTLALLLGLSACATPVPPNATFLLFFPSKSSTLTPEANAALDRAAAAIQSSHPQHVAIAAGADRGDSLPLAEPRFAAISNGLRKRGVPPELIARASLPEAEARTGATGYDRVEIILDFRK